jgi:hypothetical protein
MSEVNNISVENVEIPVESYIERLNSKLKEFSSTMSVDTEALTNEPKGGSWEEVEQYLNCIEISEKQPESITLPYWGSVQLPSPEELAEPNTEEYTPEDVLGRLFVVNAALNVEFDYYNEDTSKEESMTLGQLIGDVYPGLEEGVKEIRKELEFAFRNPEGFKKKYSEKERNIGGLTRRAFIKKGVEVTAASLFVLTSMTLASCSSKQLQTEPARVVGTYTPTATKTEEEPTSTPAETQEPSPTPTQTETPEPTAIVDGGTIEDIEKNMDEGDLIWSMVELQRMVNSYDKSSGQEFSEYIVEVRQTIPREELEYGGNYWALDKVLGKLENSGEINTMSLIYALKDSFPGLIFLDIPEGCDSIGSLLETLPEDVKQGIIDYGRKSEEGINMEPVAYYGLYDNGRAILAQSYIIDSTIFPKGEIKVDGHNYGNGFPDSVNTLIVIEELEKDGKIYPLGVMVDEDQRIRLIILSNEEGDKIFTGSYQILLLSDTAVTQAIRRQERR